MCHSCQESHNHAQGYPACKANQRREGLIFNLIVFFYFIFLLLMRNTQTKSNGFVHWSHFVKHSLQTQVFKVSV